MTCFDTRLGCLDAADDSWQLQMIDAMNKIFEVSLKLRFSVPWYRLFATPAWRRLIKLEDFFFGCVNN